MLSSTQPHYDTGPTGTPISSAEVVADGEAAWDQTCDVLVIGCGLAGAATALKAAEADDLSITIVDRFDGGGASALSGGVLYVGGGTKVQKETGVEDTPEAMARYLDYEVGGVVAKPTLERFCRESASYLPWLESHGARFGGPLTEEKTSYPYGAYLYYSGNERTKEGLKLAPPAARGHRAMPYNGSLKETAAAGYQLMQPLKRALDKARNVTFKRHAAARRLIADEDGAVIGAEIWQIPPGPRAWAHSRLNALAQNQMLTMLGITKPLFRMLIGIERNNAKPIRILARKGVVLASGGFAFNRRMVEEIAPKYALMGGLGTIGDDGSGIMLAQGIGGSTDRMATMSAWRFLYPPTAWTKGVLVSTAGTRLLNEEAYGSRTGGAIFEDANGKAFLILDKPTYDLAKQEIASPKLQPFQKLITKAAMTRYTTVADTLDELAAKIGVTGSLAATIKTYNDDIEAGRPDAFGKSEKLCRPLLQGPFAAVDLSATTVFNPIFGISSGGIRVDEETGAVLASDGRPIPGIYAAGRTALGLPSNFYVSGLSLADCMFSGWRAARSLTQRND